MQCRLCLREAELQDSHIIPEWCYGPIYDDKHRFVEVVTSDLARRKLHQKGVREELLCKGCEVKRSRWKAYARDVFYADGAVDVGLSCYQDSQKLVIEGVDYVKFKLFQLSVLWMSSISKLRVFSQVNLGQLHEENLRKMLYNEDPGTEQQYGCLVEILMEDERKPFDKIIVCPTRRYLANHTWYSFTFAFATWYFVVSDREKNMPQTTGLISTDGKITIRKVPARLSSIF